MNYKIWFDEESETAYLKIINMLNEDDVNGLIPGLDKALQDKEPRHVLVDLSTNPPGFLDKPARKAFKTFAQQIDFDKIAMFGAEPRIRMMAKAAVFALGMFNITRFFKNKKDALRWLKGDDK
ncbi:STAS/SEC14 domain-containing protein [candidate division WOR-3 bacterium]|nr:STAS/SEC14 domain-containing protein [candidate division WOR-3 bacterium]